MKHVITFKSDGPTHTLEIDVSAEKASQIAAFVYRSVFNVESNKTFKLSKGRGDDYRSIQGDGKIVSLERIGN